MNKQNEKRAALQSLVDGNINALERYRKENKIHIIIETTRYMTKEEFLKGNDEDPNELLQDIQVYYPDADGNTTPTKYPNMTRQEFKPFCQELEQRYHLFIETCTCFREEATDLTN